jgi:cytochrome P450
MLDVDNHDHEAHTPMTDINGFDLIAPQAYGERGVPHDQFRALRQLDRLHHCAPDGFDAFYPVVRHDQICEISKQPERFLNRFGIVLESQEQKRIIQTDRGIGHMRSIIGMDPPEHRDYRKVAAPWFTPRAIDRIAPIVEESARTVVDALVERASGGEGECEFANEIAAAHPLRVLSTILGVPREREPQLLRLTNELFASDDPDLQRKGEDRTVAVQALAVEFFQLFNAIVEDRRANPTDDLASLLANATVNGEPMGMMETLGYYLITFTAGHDTTKNALAGGIQALVEHPAEFEKLKRNPDLVPSAVEEIVRWTSPVNYMRRGGFSGSLLLPDRTGPESSPRVRDRRAFLSRHSSGPSVAARTAPGADRPHRHDGARRRSGPDRFELRCGLEAASDSLPTRRDDPSRLSDFLARAPGGASDPGRSSPPSTGVASSSASRAEMAPCESRNGMQVPDLRGYNRSRLGNEVHPPPEGRRQEVTR